MAAAAAGTPAAAAAAAAQGPAPPAPRAARAAVPAAANSDDDESDGLDVDAPHPGGMAAAAAAAWGAPAAAGSGAPHASPVGNASPAGGPPLVSPPPVRSAVSKRGCAFRGVDGHACGGTSHKVTAKALLAVYLRAVYIADAETAAALREVRADQGYGAPDPARLPGAVRREAPARRDGLVRGVHVLVCVVVTSGGRDALLAAPGTCVTRGRLGPGGERGRSRHPARVGRGAGLCSLRRRRSRAAGTMPLVTRARWLFSAHL
jgi:hypothetical protein